MKCKHCGCYIADDSYFCEFCGIKVIDVVIKKCEHCGQEIDYDSKYCKFCGNMAKEEVELEGYVDLGLPSGTLWNIKNEEEYYTYDEAVNVFEGELPNNEQFRELQDKCKWLWTGNGYKVVGLNGNSIILPAAGCQNFKRHLDYSGTHGRYWSSTSGNAENAWSLFFYQGRVGLYTYDRSYRHSVRLVQKVCVSSKKMSYEV